MTITALIGTEWGIDVHKPGCKDLGKAKNLWVYRREDFESIDKMYDALLDDGQGGWSEGDFKFLPCLPD